MYYIYFEDKVINFTGSCDSSCGTCIELSAGEDISITKMLEKLENSKNICVKASNPQMAFNRFVSQFILVEAAGGVVTNPDGQILMMLRHGKRDLPKGHIEQGETPRQAAAREVSEETGLRDLSVGDLLAVTHHFYTMEGRREMKRTWWYAMKADADMLIPQIEEGIEKVEWVSRECVCEYVAGSYSSIIEVVGRALSWEEDVEQ